MALNASTNLLLGSSHYSHSSSYRSYPPDPISEELVHSIGINLPRDRRASSIQSLNMIGTNSTKRSNSLSYPHLQQEESEDQTTTSPSTSTSPTRLSNRIVLTSEKKTLPFHSSLCRIDHMYQRRTSLSTNRNNDDTITFFRKKMPDELPMLTVPPKGAAVLTIENDDEPPSRKEPIEIRVRCIFSRVGEIDTLNERYTAEIFFEASWYEKYSTVGSKYDPQSGYFNPQLVVLNHMGDSLRQDKWYSVSKPDSNGLIEITEHHKIRGVFWERMELNHFPYDVQELSLSLTTPLTTSDIYFIENKQKPSGVNRTVFSDQQSWYLYEHVEFAYENHREEYSLNYDQVHPVVVCTCHVGRKCGYYIWNAYFLIFLITSAALCTFAIPPSNSHGRLQITCTLLLTSVTFRWVVNKSLPTISYLTALDVYAISSIVVLCIINVFHGIISYIYYDQLYLASAKTPVSANALHLSLYPEYPLCRLDRYAFFIFLSSFALYQILILLWTVWVPYKRRRAMSQKDEKIRAQLTIKLSRTSAE